MPLDVGGGGGGVATPGSFQVIGQVPTIQVLSGSQVQDAETITVQENTYGVVFSFTISRAEWLAEGTKAAATLYASWVQEIGSQPYTYAMAYAQDVNAAGLLIDTLVVTVGTPDGNNLANVTVPLAQANATATFTKLNQAVATLTATAALT